MFTYEFMHVLKISVIELNVHECSTFDSLALNLIYIVTFSIGGQITNNIQ